MMSNVIKELPFLIGMDVSTSNCQVPTLVRPHNTWCPMHISSKYKYQHFCLCQTALFATASWCLLFCPLSLFPESPSWPLTTLFLPLPPRLLHLLFLPLPLPPLLHLHPLLLAPLHLLPLSILMLYMAAARPLVVPHRLIVFGRAHHLGSLHGQDRTPSLHFVGQASPTHHAGLVHNLTQPQPWSLIQLQLQHQP